MPENPFAGATRDPIALLEQLITRIGALSRDMDQLKSDVGQLKSDVGELKGEVAQVRTELKAEIAQVRDEIAEMRLDLKAEIAETRHELKGDLTRLRTGVTTMHGESLQLIKLADREQQLLREQIGASVEMKTGLNRSEMKGLYMDLERRVAELEEAERRRRESAGA